MAMVAALTLTLSVAIVVYVYWGYPTLLRLLVRVLGPRPVRKADITPTLTLVISAYNEARVIRRKLENAVSLDYPAGALDIVVISDASDDGTDEIVAEFADRGVRLMRQPERRGKTAGLNRTIPTLTSEIVVFSDANAIYRHDALRHLARNFADPDVGCVTGEARYVTGDRSAADIGERMYWDYEMQIKRLESALGSMVGGDGAIYAIRRSLWRGLPETAINDFLNPLQIVEAGWRAVYEPEAVCYEETAGGMRIEYGRRVRIVSRSWRAVFQARGVLNPFRVGLFTWSLISHKVLRWFSGALGMIAAMSAIVLAAEILWPYATATTVAVLAAACLVIATRRGRQLAGMAAYFTAVNAGSLIGLIKGSLGSVSGTWSTPRLAGAAPGPLLPVGLLVQVTVTVLVLAVPLLYWAVGGHAMAAAVFWFSASMLTFIYLGYPALIALARLVGGRPVHRAPIEPSVCLFVTANDEGAVIEEKLENALALDYPADRLEIVVASDGSVDDTNDIVRRFAPRVRLLALYPRRGKIAAINEGVKALTSEIIVFSDANTFLQPDAIRALVRSFADPQVGGVSGDVVLVGERAKLGPSEDLYYRYERWVQRVESEIGSMIGADGALYAIRRELFVPPPADTILDDMAIPMGVIKAGKRVVFDGEARAFEQGSETALEEFARKARVIAGAMQFVRRSESAVPLAAPQVIFSLVSHKMLRWLSPAFITGALVSSLVLADTATSYAAAVLGQVTLLTLAAAGCVPALRRIKVVAIAHYFCLLQAAAGVGFIRGLAGRQSVLWRRFDRVRVAPLRVRS